MRCTLYVHYILITHLHFHRCMISHTLRINTSMPETPINARIHTSIIFTLRRTQRNTDNTHSSPDERALTSTHQLWLFIYLYFLKLYLDEFIYLWKAMTNCLCRVGVVQFDLKCRPLYISPPLVL